MLIINITQEKLKYLKSKFTSILICIHVLSNLYSRADTAVTPTYDEIIVKQATTTTGVPIYDTPMELQTNTAYEAIINKDIINVHNNDAYGQIMI